MLEYKERLHVFHFVERTDSDRVRASIFENALVAPFCAMSLLAVSLLDLFGITICE